MNGKNGETELAVPESAGPAGTSLILSKDHVGVVMNNIRVLTEGFKEWLVEGVDYTKELYGRDAKPALLDTGTFKVINFFQVRPRHHVLEHILVGDEGKERVKYVMAAELLNPKTGFIVAEGVGSCSTDEVRYQYRWLTVSKLKNIHGYTDSDIAQLPLREIQSRRGGKFPVYRIRNPDILDLDNTIVKMASKRAEMDAALQLPGVSAVFTQDLGDQSAIRKQVESEAHVKQPAAEEESREPERAHVGPPPRPTEESPDDVEKQKLPRGVGSLEELEYLFQERIPGYEELLQFVPVADGFSVEHRATLEDELEKLVDHMVTEMGGGRMKRGGLYGVDWVIPFRKTAS